MSEILLTLRGVENRLQELEAQYGFSTEEFRNDPECRHRVSGEDEFEWEASLVHADVFREQERELHRDYVLYVTSAPCGKTDKSQVVLQLVA